MYPVLILKTILINDMAGQLKNYSWVIMLPQVGKYMVHLFQVNLMCHLNMGWDHWDLISDINASQFHIPYNNSNQILEVTNICWTQIRGCIQFRAMPWWMWRRGSHTEFHCLLLQMILNDIYTFLWIFTRIECISLNTVGQNNLWNFSI